MAGPSTVVLVHDAQPPAVTDDPENPSSPTPPIANDLPSSSDDQVIPLPTWRRWVILLTVSWLPIPMNFAVTSVFAVAPEVAAGLSVSESVMSTANAGVFVIMAISPLIWIPLVDLLGRRITYLASAVLLSVCSVGQVFAPDVASFFVLWALSGATAVILLVAGQTIIADVFKPVGPCAYCC